MKEYVNTGNVDTRSGFGAGLTELGKINNNVVALCADLTGSLKMNEFEANHPERFFQVGIAEANMMGIAAGMTIGGKIPFTGTFANFSTGKLLDTFKTFFWQFLSAIFAFIDAGEYFDFAATSLSFFFMSFVRLTSIFWSVFVNVLHAAFLELLQLYRRRSCRTFARILFCC